MMPFGTPLDRPDVHLSDISDTVSDGISVSAEAAARVFENAARRIRKREGVRDVCEGLVDVVIALSGRI